MVATGPRKRLSSDSESDFLEDSSGELTNVSEHSLSSNDDVSCFSTARKRRRGLIEKRRRDRINKSLNELKNLIPTANERQAAAKLEKSEVLSLAVDHIKALQMRDRSSPQMIAMEYRGIGYRECINEIITYLVNMEGLGPTDPLHVRMVSYLQQQMPLTDQMSSYYCMTQAAQQTPYPASPSFYPPVQSTCKPDLPSPPYQAESPSNSYFPRYSDYNININITQYENGNLPHGGLPHACLPQGNPLHGSPLQGNPSRQNNHSPSSYQLTHSSFLV